MVKKITSTTSKGLIISAILIILSLVIYFAKINTANPAGWTTFLLLSIGAAWSVYSYGRQINFNGTFGNYFTHGFKVTAVATVILVVFTILSIIIFPDIKEKAFEEARKQLQQSNQLTQIEINESIERYKKLFMSFAVGGALLFYLIFGVIGAIAGAVITKKDTKHAGQAIDQIGK